MKRFLFILCLFLPIYAEWFEFFSSPENAAKPPFTIMIDPAGDAQTPGRTIHDTFERSVTLQAAEELKRLLEESKTKIKVIITRSAGETVESLQKISYANRASIDLYITLHFFEKKQGAAQLFFYTLMYDAQTDIGIKKKDDIELIPFDQAYRVSLQESQQFASRLFQFCENKLLPKQLICKAPIAFPFKPLIGIMAPSVGIELGISEKNQWQSIIPLLAQALEDIAQ